MDLCLVAGVLMIEFCVNRVCDLSFRPAAETVEFEGLSCVHSEVQTIESCS